METFLIAVGALVLYIIAYHTYGRWLARKIFRLNADAPMPSVELNDDKDYVPTAKGVVFGHHFTSIAGTGPIVGPAIAVLWGWLPALLWVLFGSILIGAVHDFGALVVSMRNRGQTVGDIAGRVLNPRVRLLFLSILFMALTIVLAIFGLVIATVFQLFPASIFPCLVQIPMAVFIGLYFHRRGVHLLVPSLAVLGLMYFSVYEGDAGFLHDWNATMAGWPLMVWVVLLLVYSYVASVIPVWALLQPRDYINSLQLISALALILVGLFAAAFFGGAPLSEGGARPALELVAPARNLSPPGAPAFIPFLFITIACGAISGFHCLVSSGTTSKQLRCETDAQFVGYGSMLTEGFLAVLVILACTAGIGLGTNLGGTAASGTAAWQAHYGADWAALKLPQLVGAFVVGSANFLKALGLKPVFAEALMGVLVASFAATTLDTACRLQRYVIQELAGSLLKHRQVVAPGTGIPLGANPLSWLANKHGATVLAVLLAVVIACMPPVGKEWSLANAGKGGTLLWPLFGATNQLLGGLAFMVIAFWMWRRRIPVWFVIVPMLFMLAIPAWAMALEVFKAGGWLQTGRWVLAGVGLATIALEIWMLVEAVLAWPRAKGVLEEALPPLGKREPQTEGGRSC